MAESVIAKIRAAFNGGKKISVSLADARAEGQGLKLLIGTGLEWKGPAQSSGAALPKPAVPEQASTGGNGVKPPRAHLTAREIQVLKLIAQGKHNREIAARIHRSIKTVEKHRQNLNSKLSAHEVAGLTRRALSMGLVGK